MQMTSWKQFNGPLLCEVCSKSAKHEVQLEGQKHSEVAY